MDFQVGGFPRVDAFGKDKAAATNLTDQQHFEYPVPLCCK